MSRLNPNALLLIALAAVTGYLAGSWAWGLEAGLVVVLVASFAPPLYDKWGAFRHRRRFR